MEVDMQRSLARLIEQHGTGQICSSTFFSRLSQLQGSAPASPYLTSGASALSGISEPVTIQARPNYLGDSFNGNIPELLTPAKALELAKQRGPGREGIEFLQDGRCGPQLPQSPPDRTRKAGFSSSAGSWNLRSNDRLPTALLVSELPMTGSRQRSNSAGSRSGSAVTNSSASLLPPSSLSDFPRRTEVWEMQRQRRLEQLRARHVSKQLQECSFHPASKRAGEGTRAEADAVAARLYTPLASSQSRTPEAIRQRREELQEAELRECTFAPNLSRSSSSLRLSVGAAVPSKPCRKDISDEGPRYHPQTNAVPQHMMKASSYVQQNVFHRLSRASDVQDAGQPLEADQEPAQKAQVEQLQRSTPDVSSVSMGSSGANTSSFISFLKRQNDAEAERRRKLQQLEVATAPTLQPELSDLSRRLVDRQRQRSRSRDAKSPRPMSQLRGRSASPGLRSSMSAAALGGRQRSEERLPREGHSYRPEICPSSARRPRRGFEELSTGDQHRRFEKTMLLQQKLQEEENSVATYAPKLNEMSAQFRGRLRVLEEPDSYVNRLTEHREQVLAWRAHQVQERIDKALAECTFRPTVNDGAPAYVRRSAESYRVHKSYREKENESVAKPEWR